VTEPAIDTMTASASGEKTPARFPVAGVGASAGGLAATTELLRHLGPRPDIGVVIVHHLDPSHESSLVDIFSRVTTLPVETVSDRMRVKPNHVYVVPPNAGVGIIDGRLSLTPRIETGGLHLPIDRFLESLAHDRTVQALGIVLTGTGSDGTVGVRAIKAQGGVTFAQDSSAEYRSMPETAIATGCVDFILPPDGIGRELARIGGLSRLPSAADDPRDFQRILSELGRSSGIDFASYKPATLHRRVQRRVVVNGLTSLHEYAELVETSSEEARSLCEEVLIHVTSFFRDPQTFEALRTLVLPRLLDNRPRDAGLRVWVPGCSTGEEVYSIAIILLEFLGEAHAGDGPIKLFGTDVSLGAIEGARRAKYPATIEHDVSPGRLGRFFSKLEGGYQIRKDVRDLCVFARHDATRDPPFASIDLISCRNLMIYLGSPLQDRLLPIFHYALKEPGFLVLGTSETARSFQGFAVLDAKNRIYGRTSVAPRLLFDFAEGQRGENVFHDGQDRTRRPTGPLDVEREADRLVLAEHAPPGVVITDDLAVIQFRGRTGPFFEPAPGVASLDLLRMVREDLRLPLRQAIDEARVKQATTRRTGPAIAAEPAPRNVEIEVIPFRVASTTQRFFVVLFREASSPAPRGEVPLGPDIVRERGEGPVVQELASTREYLESVIEQAEAANEELKAANEEIVSSNEELRSTNEELQMAKEELQATNEELSTVNDEMAVRNVDATRLSDDLANVLGSVDIPIVLLGRDGRIRRFTPAAGKVFHLIANDVGRPITDIRQIIPPSELTDTITEVLERLTVVKRTVRDEDGRWHELIVRPYLTTDKRIDGTVITAIDIDAASKAGQLVAEAKRYAESIIDTIRAGLVVVDGDLRVRSANRAFCRVFGATEAELKGQRLDDIGRGEWNLPVLQQRLHQLGKDDRIEDYRIEIDSHFTGYRVFLLNARRVEETRSILLAIEDITAKERAERALQRTETGFREMLTTIGEAILMTDGAGRIVFANEMVTRMFGYALDELMGLPVDTLVSETTRPRDRVEALVAPVARRVGLEGHLTGRRKDGAEFPIKGVVGSIRQESGPLVMSFISDITQQRESERRLGDYQEKLQRMAFDAALSEERERRRIAADLHDRIGQSLTLAQIKLTSARETIGGAARAAVDHAVDLLEQSVIDTRTLTFELSPPVLYDLGFKAALSWLIEDIQKRHGIAIELSDDGAEEFLDDGSAALVFRAVRELLMNVFKHAHTPSAKVSLRRIDDQFEIDVEDQGVGFDPSDATVALLNGGFGLFSVREQIGRLGGKLEIVSAPQGGTRVNIRLPVKANTREPSRTEVREEIP